MSLLIRLIFLLAISSIAVTSLNVTPALAAGACRDIFSAPKYTETKELEPLSAKAIDQQFRVIQFELTDPYSLAFDVRQELISRGADPEAKLVELFGHIRSARHSHDLGERLNQWTESEAQALLAADVLLTLGFKRHQEVIEHLYTHNIYFSDAHPIRGPPSESSLAKGLVTFSFEKEGFNALITDFYRNPKISEKDWMALPLEERIQRLRSMRVPMKEFLSSDIVSPTAKKLPFLGGFSVELPDSQRKGWSWEIAHKKFEISRYRIMQQVRSLSAHFKETHSFHFHIVFELPKSYPHFSRFISWHKRINDYLYLRGLEEGLHGNNLTNIVNDKRDLSLMERVRAWIKPQRPSQLVPTQQSKINKYGAKFFTVGLRGGSLYGGASSPENMKLGLEFRDSTRSLESLDQYTKEITDAVTEYRWEKLSSELQASKETPRLTTAASKSRAALSAVVGEKWATYFHEMEPSSALPLTGFESGTYFNYRSGKFETASVEVVQRLQAARKVYETSLKNLINEIVAMQARGEKIDPQEVKPAIRMSMSEWAKLARASELYSSY